MYGVDSSTCDANPAVGVEFELRPERTGSAGERISGQLDSAIPQSGLLQKIKHARERLERAGSLVASVRSKLGEADRTQLEHGELLSHLHVLERSHFSRQLELDALLKKRRELSDP